LLAVQNCKTAKQNPENVENISSQRTVKHNPRPLKECSFAKVKNTLKRTKPKSRTKTHRPKSKTETRKYTNTQEIQRNTKFFTNLSISRLGRDDKTNWDEDEEDEDKPNHGFCVL
jgi:hypothetical protein